MLAVHAAELASHAATLAFHAAALALHAATLAVYAATLLPHSDQSRTYLTFPAHGWPIRLHERPTQHRG